MIEVVLIKHDVYLGKTHTKTWNVATVEGARNRAKAFAEVHRCPPDQLQEEVDGDGNLVKITIDCRPPPPGPSPEQVAIAQLTSKVSELEERLLKLEGR